MSRHEVLCEPPSAARATPRSGWLEESVRGLIQRAARRAPPSLSARLEEEWLADLRSRHGAGARLRFALGCCWATRVIALEFGAPVREAATTSDDKTVAVCRQVAPSSHSRRVTVTVLIASLHLLVIYGLATGMARKILEAVPDRIQVGFMPQAPTRYEPLPPLNTRLAQVRLTDPSSHWTFDVRLDPVTIAAADLEPPALMAASQPKAAQRLLGGPGAGFPNTADYYPDASRRLGEKGTATVQVCVDGAGRLTADPAIALSSGSARLDAGALKLARAGSGRYRATTEEGRPVSGCYPFRVKFDLKD